MKKKRILTTFAAILIAVLCAWRLWPHSLKSILGVNEEAFNTITITVSEFGIVNHAPEIDTYRLDISSPNDDISETLGELFLSVDSTLLPPQTTLCGVFFASSKKASSTCNKYLTKVQLF